MGPIALFTVLTGCAPTVQGDPGPPDASEASPGEPAPEYPDDVVAIVGALVLTMVDDTAQPVAATVVLHGDTILDVAAPDVALPPTAEIIDAQGATVMPGLVDAHAHIWYEGELTLLLANGVTTVRNLFGSELQRTWRKEIRRGDRLGPNVVTSGPIVDGSPPLWPTSDVVVTEADAEVVVASQVDDNYDQIKVYNVLQPGAWSAILAAAEAHDIDVAGHVPWTVGWDEVVGSSQHTIEHLDGLVDVVGDTGVGTFLYDVAGMTAAMDARDDARLQAAAEQVADDGVVVVPTLVVHDLFYTEDERAVLQADPRMAYVHPDIVASWAFSPSLPQATDDMLSRYTRALQDYTEVLFAAGATVALGTDANNAYVIPGFSVHQELALLVDAGLTPYEALLAGTVHAAAAVGMPDVGTIEVGQRADLLVLSGDPSTDVARAQDRVGVVVGGLWYPEQALQAELDLLAATYAARRADAPGPTRVPTCAHSP